MKIDIHTHILPREIPMWADKFGYGRFVHLEDCGPCTARMMVGDKFFREVESNCWDPEVRLTDCDRDGIHVQVLSIVPVLFNYWAKPADTADLARILNDHIAGLVNEFPKRFVGLGTLPMQDADLSIRELERCQRSLGMAGIQIGTHVNGWNLDDPRIFPVLEAAAELGAAVFVHPWQMLGKERMGLYWLPWLVGMPAELSRAICSMIFGGVLERLPRLRICFAHGGGSFPFTIGRIEHGFRMRPDLVATRNGVNPREYLGRIFVDSVTHDPQSLKYLLEVAGVGQVMLGSDYPFPLGEQRPGSAVDALGLPEPDQKSLFHANAMRWLSPPLSPCGFRSNKCRMPNNSAISSTR